MFGDNGASDTAEKIQEQQQNQIDQQNEDLDRKKQALFTTKLDLIKSQNAQNWGSPNNPSPGMQGKQDLNQ